MGEELKSCTTDGKEFDPTIGPDGQQNNYKVLCEEERAKGFVRPLRTSYRHVGIPGPKYPLRDLSDEEKKIYSDYPYVKFEEYPTECSPLTGRFWTQEQLNKVDKGCGTVTIMGNALAETYARKPDYYGSTYCAGCGIHLPVGDAGEFIWDGTDERVGT